MEKFFVKNTFLTGYSGRLLLILRKLDSQTLNSEHIKSKSNSNNSFLINFVDKLYLMSKNVVLFLWSCSQDLHLQPTYYKNNFSQKSLVYISVSTQTFKPQILKKNYITFCMVFIKHNSLKSDIFFNVVIIPCFSGFMLFRVQSFLGSRLFRVFLGPGFSVSRFFRAQVF